MRYAQLATILAFSAALTATACNRAQPAAEEAAATVRDEAAEARAKMESEAAELETKVDNLDREWNEMTAKMAAEKNKATTALQAEVKEDIANAKEAVADLKTTTEANWWERHEQRMERTADDVEADVKRFARKWSAPKIEAEVAAAGDAWEARRDRFAARMEARIEAMENALKDVDVKGAAETEVEDTRARLKKMREDTDRLKNATEKDWWDITRARVNDYIERVDRSIRRLDDDKG